MAIALGITCVAPSAVAATDPPAPGAAEPQAPAAPAPPAPYSIPWQLRFAGAVDAVRSDTAVAFYEATDATGQTKSGSTVASMLLFCKRITPELAPMVRVGFVENGPPIGASGSAFLDPIVGGTWAHPLGHEVRMAAFLGVTLPVGQGGGNSPEPEVTAANKAGMAARSGLDNAMFAPNYTAILPAVDVAWVAHGLTVQAEAGLFELVRVRGAKASPDGSNTNSVLGLHVGTFLVPQLSVGGELRYQRWLSTPAAIKDMTGKIVESRRDNLTFALGARGHFELPGAMGLRPGVAYARALDKPLSDAKYDILQIDVLFPF